MKAKINIRQFIEEHANHKDMLLMHAGVHVSALFATNDIPDEHEFDIDLHDLLAENRLIAHLWGTEDVQEVRPDLTDEQAWEVLQLCDRRKDCAMGITWDTLELIAGELYGPKPCEERWYGRIEVTIHNTEDYGLAEISNRLQDMCALLAEDMPDLQATVVPESICLRDADSNGE